MEDTYSRIKVEVIRVRLQINVPKTKYMRAKSSKENSLRFSQRVTINGDELEMVKGFVYCLVKYPHSEKNITIDLCRPPQFYCGPCFPIGEYLDSVGVSSLEVKAVQYKTLMIGCSLWA